MLVVPIPKLKVMLVIHKYGTLHHSTLVVPMEAGQFAQGQFAQGQLAQGQFAQGQFAHGQFAQKNEKIKLKKPNLSILI